MLRNLDQLDKTAKTQKKVLKKIRHIFGEKYLYTFSTINNLAFMLEDLDQLDKTITILEATVQKIRQIYNKEYLCTKIVIDNWTRLVASRAVYTAVVANKNSYKKSKKSSLYARFGERFYKKDFINKI